nr:uncharacterized protein LOC129284245 [Lytechinus pictus]
MKKSVNLTQYGDTIQALQGLSTTSNPHSSTPRMKPSCCHGNRTSEDDAVRRTSQVCYECQSYPWGYCGEGFHPTSTGVMEVQCDHGCQKSVHPAYVSRGCLSLDHYDECTNKVCMTSPCTHCCNGDLCNKAQHSIHISTSGIALNFQAILLLLLNTCLLQYD